MPPRRPASSPRPARAGRRPPAARLKILFVVSECAPCAKVGGLGDVAAALPKALRKLGHDARLLLPLYDSVDRVRHGIRFERPVCVHMGGGEEQWIGLHRATLEGGVPAWFVDCERFFKRPGIYDEPGGEYADNAFRFALFSRSALQICKDTRFIPHVMHAHDWPSALVPAFLKTWDRILSPLSRTASVLTIHNVGYQGVHSAHAYPYFGIGWEHFVSDRFEDHGKVNLLKAGIAFADALTTVSPSHAVEMLSPEGGCGLAPHLDRRRDDFTGILNGVDEEHWNPETDMLLPARYTADNLRGKAACKAALQKRLGLDPKGKVPLFGIISRMVHQKGFGLLMEALPRVLDTMVCQVAALGSGEPAIEAFFRDLAARYPGRVGAHIGYSNELSHWIEAGSDFFLMPSLYEPCGLNQMYSLRYGSLPIVRATGGLNDTVENYDEATGDGTGFKFLHPTPLALYNTIGWAVSTWFDRPRHLKQLRHQAMSKRFPWDAAARRYVEVYRRALANRRTRT